jgi:saccharopine dehydrogenase (NADP+, L-glutamate forming)
LSSAQALAHGLPRARAMCLDVTSSQDLDETVAAHDIVISLVPAMYHPVVIKAAIRGQTHAVTTSYISPAIRELENEIKIAGIAVINEVGLDPGIDHLYAIKMIDEIHNKGGKVKEFHSYCGGLPAPEHADNPLRFRFSWSPRGSLLAQCNPASYILNGKVVEICGVDLMDTATDYHVMDGYDFEAYPNRNSVPFREYYNIPEARTIVRGSLRYKGNPAVVGALTKLGWLDAEDRGWLTEGITWAQVQQRLVGSEGSDEA